MVGSFPINHLRNEAVSGFFQDLIGLQLVCHLSQVCLFSTLKLDRMLVFYSKTWHWSNRRSMNTEHKYSVVWTTDALSWRSIAKQRTLWNRTNAIIVSRFTGFIVAGHASVKRLPFLGINYSRCTNSCSSIRQTDLLVQSKRSWKQFNKDQQFSPHLRSIVVFGLTIKGLMGSSHKPRWIPLFQEIFSITDSWKRWPDQIVIVNTINLKIVSLGS